MFHKRSGVTIRSGRTGRQLVLTGTERKTLRATWHSVTDRQSLGREVLLQVFRENVSLKRLFKIKCDLDDIDGIVRDSNFIKHADAFAMFLHIAVNRLLSGANDNLIQLVHSVGRTHAGFEKVNFDAEYWLLFKAAVLDTLEPYFVTAKCLKPFARGVWDRLLMFLIMEMKTAFHQHLIARLSCPNLVKALHFTLLRDYQECNLLTEEEESTALRRMHSLNYGALAATPVTDPLPRRNTFSKGRRGGYDSGADGAVQWETKTPLDDDDEDNDATDPPIDNDATDPPIGLADDAQQAQVESVAQPESPIKHPVRKKSSVRAPVTQASPETKVKTAKAPLERTGRRERTSDSKLVGLYRYIRGVSKRRRDKLSMCSERTLPVIVVNEPCSE